MRCEDVRVYVLASVPPLAILTHRHPTPGMVAVGAGVCRWWLAGGHLSDDGASCARPVRDEVVLKRWESS